MRHPKFNILASLSDDQKKEVRDIIVELLLSTDMGNHAKIFSQFRRRAAENPDWYTRREDVKLGMVMAIKVCVGCEPRASEKKQTSKQSNFLI